MHDEATTTRLIYILFNSNGKRTFEREMLDQIPFFNAVLRSDLP